MKTMVSKYLYVFYFLSLSAWSASDTVPLNKKPSKIKANDFTAVTERLKAKSGKEPEPILGSEEAKLQKPQLGSVGVYGTKKLNEVILKELLGKDFEIWIQKGLANDPNSIELEKKLVDKIQKKFNFPLAEFSVVQFFEPENISVHIVLDVVEKADLEDRINFISEPTGQFPDPDSLIHSWLDYENKALDLIESGQLSPEGQRCQSLHCPFGHEHPSLQKYAAIFSEGVKKNYEKLLEILAKDKRPEYRSASAYLLPYLMDGKKVIPPLIEKIRDPDAIVRNNSLRVLGEIAEFHPEFVIPIKPIIPALNYPKASDRSKAVFIVYLLSLNSSSARDEILKEAVPNLLLLLETKIPDQKEVAHNTLKKISGKEFPVTDSTSWKNWYAKLKKDKGLPVAK